MWWLARGEEHLPGERSWLSRGEADYVESKRFTKRRSEFLVARWAAKQALARVLSTPSTLEGLRRIEVRHAASAPGRAGWAATWNSSNRAPTGSSATT